MPWQGQPCSRAAVILPDCGVSEATATEVSGFERLEQASGDAVCVVGADVVAGVQGSLQSLFGLTTYAATLLAPTLSAFPWLMAASCGIVTAAALLVSCSVPALLAPASVPQHVPPEADI